MNGIANQTIGSEKELTRNTVANAFEAFTLFLEGIEHEKLYQHSPKKGLEEAEQIIVANENQS
jgi:hypothetical protein